MAQKHGERLRLYRRRIAAAVLFAVVIESWLVMLGEGTGAVFLAGLAAVVFLLAVLGSRRVKREARNQGLRLNGHTRVGGAWEGAPPGDSTLLSSASSGSFPGVVAVLIWSPGDARKGR